MDYCSINTVLEGADYRNAEEWPVIAEFQAKALKELADFVFYPYGSIIIPALIQIITNNIITAFFAVSSIKSVNRKIYNIFRYHTVQKCIVSG